MNAVAKALLTERFEGIEEELEDHIDSLAWAWRTAYDRYERYGLPADRDEALMFLHLHNQAVLSRSPAVQAQRHAEFERGLTEQVAYFTSEAAVRLAEGARRA